MMFRIGEKRVGCGVAEQCVKAYVLRELCGSGIQIQDNYPLREAFGGLQDMPSREETEPLGVREQTHVTKICPTDVDP